jgi:hypothetical protein
VNDVVSSYYQKYSLYNIVNEEELSEALSSIDNILKENVINQLKECRRFLKFAYVREYCLIRDNIQQHHHHHHINHGNCYCLLSESDMIELEKLTIKFEESILNSSTSINEGEFACFIRITNQILQKVCEASEFRAN